MADETWASLAARHRGFCSGVETLFEQAIVVEPCIATRAYALLVAVHAAGLDSPTHVELPSIVWEKRTAARVATATITLRDGWWDGLLIACDNLGSDKIAGAWSGTPQAIALNIKRFFREDHGE